DLNHKCLVRLHPQSRQRCEMRGQTRRFWVTGSMVAAATLLLPRRASAAIRMVSLAFNSQQQNPQQLAADEFRQKLMAMAGKHFVVDARAGNSLGSENIILAAAQSGAVDVAVISGGVVSATVPEMSVFDIPFLFRDTAHAKAVAQGPVGTAIAAKFADK